MDPSTAALIDGLRAATNVADLSGKIDHSSRHLVATGGYSTVYTAGWKSPSSKIPLKVCYKELRPRVTNMPEMKIKIKKTVKYLTREMGIWSILKHPHILEFLGFAVEEEGCDVRGVLISVWCSNGNVTEYLKENPKSDRIALARDVAKGLDYLHHRYPIIVHGDLKPANVLVGDDRRAILCDFGLSRISNELSTDQTSSVMGATPRWTAPEVIFDEKKTVKGDIYSFACTCIQILFDQQPFPNQNDNQVILAIDKRQPPWEWHQEDPLECTLSSCCSILPEDRPPIGDVLKRIASPECKPSIPLGSSVPNVGGIMREALETSPRTPLGKNLPVEVITVPSRAVGRIIGKDGATIQFIRNETGTQISIEDEDPDAVIEIRGTVSGRTAAKKMLIAMSNEEIMIIEPKYHGIILGKEGQGLKEIIRQAQGSTRERAYVKFPPKDGPPSSEVKLEGPEEVLAKIKKCFEDIIAKHRYVVGTVIPAPLHARIIGPKGENLHTILSGHEVDIQFPLSTRYKSLGDVDNMEEMKDVDPREVVKVRGSQAACALAIKELKVYSKTHSETGRWLRPDSPASIVAVKGDESDADSDINDE